MSTEFISPMLANKIDIEDIPSKAADYVMEPKLDGVRCIVVRRYDQLTKSPVVRLYTRAGKELTDKLPWLVKQFIDGWDREEFVLDGELGYWVREVTPLVMDFNKTMRVVGSGNAEAIRKQFDYYAHDGSTIAFAGFDLLSIWGEDWTCVADWRRRTELVALLDRPARKIDEVPDIWLVYRAEYNEEFYRSVVDLGGEGVILKNPNAVYKPGKRPAGRWYKLKKFNTEDAKIVGYLDGQGKYTGQIGALLFRTSTGLTGKCSGITDELRREISEHKAEYIGRWFEFRYFGMVGKGETGFRHPQFSRWRQDLDD